MNDAVYWIWLSLSCTIDTGTFSKLMSKFDSARAVYDASEREIADCIGYKTSDRSSLASKDLGRAEEIYDFCITHKVGLLKYCDKEYPLALKRTPTPPVVLYYRGKLPDFNSGLYVAMVGTRELSEYGRKNAFNIGYDLATAGVTVVSGMALGIDGVALAGALAAEKPTIAVLGSGIDVCYPSQHLTLAREIVRKGCILTEYPPKTKPNKYNFPKRNRIISGLCAATFVIEGRERSGALITARYAEQQERVVFALPGNVGSAQSELTNMLLKKNAKPATRAEDVLDVFENEHKETINRFLLSDKRNIDMMFVLRTLEVVANCPSDDIYNQPWIIKRTSRKDSFSSESANALGSGAAKALGSGSPENQNANIPQSQISDTAESKSSACTSDRSAAYREEYERVSSPSPEKAYFRVPDGFNHGGYSESVRSAMPVLKRGDELSTVYHGSRPFSNPSANEEKSDFDFDEQTMKIYKKIPPGGAVEIEELTTESMPMRVVMKYLTRLETGKFIVILPGGKVMRKY